MSVSIMYNGNKKAIKIAPNQPLQYLLEQAALYFKIDSQQCILVKNKTKVPLDCPFQFSSIPNNSTLDLVVNVGSSSPCRIAVSFEGATLSATLPASSTLADVILHFIAEGKLGPEDFMSLRNPELIYLRSSHTGEALQNTTLASLGLTGYAKKTCFRAQI